MAARRVKTPVAGPDYSPLPAAPLKARVVTNLEITSGSATLHACADDTIMIRILTKGAIYIAEGEDATASSQELSPLGGAGLYDTRGVEPGALISMRAVTGTVSVQIVEW
jgi:hypothetical protein